MRASAAVILLMIWCLPASALSPSVSYADAERAFSQLAIGERFLFKVLLTTAGYWPAVADADFSRGLFDATTHYQADNGLPATGVIDKELLARLYRNGAPLLKVWGFQQVAHPYRGHPIWVPMGLGLVAERDKNGLTWRDPEKRVWVTYDWLPGVNLAAAYNAVLAKVVADGGQISFQMLKSDYFVVSSATNGLDSYIRCQSDRPDALWLSIFWLHDASDLHMERAATLMSGSFASAMSGAPFANIPQLPP
ncbi:peptidoglycan-binding domain-containing protein [Methylocella tundrae]|uniref:Peptidoglycan-binding domain 1 protein n=1 Tax=Methylocella tundrae TaxID=227605 RepID=A0A4U8YZI8_METTU